MAKGKQHYVPQCLLLAFRSSVTTKLPHVWCFDKRNDKISSVSIEDVCAESYFYTFDGTYGMDEIFRKVENKACPCHQGLIQTKDLATLVPRDKVAIAMLVATQHMRTRGFRNTITDALSQANSPSSLSIGSGEEDAKRWQFARGARKVMKGEFAADVEHRGKVGSRTGRWTVRREWMDPGVADATPMSFQRSGSGVPSIVAHRAAASSCSAWMPGITADERARLLAKTWS